MLKVSKGFVRFSSTLGSAGVESIGGNKFVPRVILHTMFNKDCTSITFRDKETDPPETVSFSNLFLRDSSRSAKSTDKASGQKLFTTGQLLSNPQATTPSQVNVTTDCQGLTIKWQDGDEYTYPLEFIVRYSRGLFDGKSGVLSPLLWDKKLLKSNIKELLSTNYESLMNGTDLKPLFQMLQNLQKYGICFVSNIPTETRSDAHVKRIAERIGNIQHTFYGETFDVVNKGSPENIAYTSRALPLHQDLLYLESIPGWQLLHSIHNSDGAGDAGMNFFVDAFYAARIIRDTDADAYEALKHVPINYHYMRDDKRYQEARPVIVENDMTTDNTMPSNYGDLIKQINYSPPFQAPFSFGIWEKPKGVDLSTPSSKLTERLLFKDFARRLALFEEIINKPDNQFRVKIPEGTCVIFNNRRILHGRTAFSGTRHLKGCYVDDDSFKSKLRYLSEKFM
ncbi:LAMI_0E01530g1_1 [Lachancea mirantina]|uniref:LAMI_0E01530g1_1 n=1 Tax=Lachancea mirantina TaxID=1230905 RepID=A0A1G4JIU9_9SACH|nr:LAMI_0E01530g1_1 [Lachancea mirantina]